MDVSRALNIQDRPVSRLSLRTEEEPFLISTTPSNRLCFRKVHHVVRFLCRHSVSLGPVVILLASNFLVSMFVGYIESLLIMAATIYSGPLTVVFLLSPLAGYAILSLFSPCITWLVDHYCGRKKAAQGALILLVIPAVFTSLALLTFLGPELQVANVLSILKYKKVTPMTFRTTEAFAFVSLCSLLVGLLIFKAGVVQLGCDKLGYLTPTKASWLAHWLLWTDYAGREVPDIYVITYFFSSATTRGYFIIFIFMMCLLSLLVLLKCIQCSFNRCYFREPKVDNHCLLICRVLYHSRKNRSPRRERLDAEGVPTSCLDAAKVQFGGPFNSIQVERVKSTISVFLRVVAIALASGLSTCAQWFLPLLSRILDKDSDFTTAPFCNSPGLCLEAIIKRINAFGNLSNLFLIVLIPFLCPILAKSVTSTGSLKKFGIGLTLLTISIVCSFAVDTATSARYQGPTVCGFQLSQNGIASTYDSSSLLLIVQNLLNASSVLLTYTAALEFVLLNTPLSMRATVLCLLFSLQGVFSFTGVLVILPFSVYFGSGNNNIPQYPSCTFGYYVTNVIVAVVVLAVFMLCARTYKPPAYIGSNPLEEENAAQDEVREMESSVV